MVTIGHASINENNKITGGVPGDQTTKEVCTRKYYLHKKGWRVIRPKDLHVANKIAEACVAATANDNIGYDQRLRDTLWNSVKQNGYNPATAPKPCATDCSALVRVCCAYAGVVLQNFNTSSEARVLLNSGMFKEVTSFNPNTGSGLKVGDILVTKVKGHTAIVVEADPVSVPVTYYTINGVKVRTLKSGDTGDIVKTLQRLLVSRGFTSLGDIDGDFGPKTQKAVEAFQNSKGLTCDGIVGKNTWGKLLNNEL